MFACYKIMCNFANDKPIIMKEVKYIAWWWRCSR